LGLGMRIGRRTQDAGVVVAVGAGSRAHRFWPRIRTGSLPPHTPHTLVRLGHRVKARDAAPGSLALAVPVPPHDALTPTSQYPTHLMPNSQHRIDYLAPRT